MITLLSLTIVLLLLLLQVMNVNILNPLLHVVRSSMMLGTASPVLLVSGSLIVLIDTIIVPVWLLYLSIIVWLLTCLTLWDSTSCIGVMWSISTLSLGLLMVNLTRSIITLRLIWRILPSNHIFGMRKSTAI